MRGREYGGVLLVSFENLGFECCGFPTLGRSLLFSTGTPPSPLLLRKILKINDLFYDYVLDL